MSSKDLGVKPHIDRLRRFIKAERQMREQVFQPTSMDRRKLRAQKLADCDEALLALQFIEEVFIPRVRQEELF